MIIRIEEEKKVKYKRNNLVAAKDESQLASENTVFAMTCPLTPTAICACISTCVSTRNRVSQPLS
jgi:hypothetical protein